MSESDVAARLPEGEAGVTRVTDRGEVVDAGVATARPDDVPPVVSIRTVATLSPASRTVRSAFRLSVIPSGGSVPLDGVMMSQGRSLVAVKGTAAPRPGTNSVRGNVPVPKGTTAWGEARATTIDASDENGPGRER